MDRLNKRIISVAALLSEPTLAMPSYQRPYKWTQKNLNDLMADIRRYRGKSAYRLGTVVFHRHCDDIDQKHIEILDIVDGQQRTLTLMLLAKAILKSKSSVTLH